MIFNDNGPVAWDNGTPIFIYAIHLNRWQVLWRKIKNFFLGGKSVFYISRKGPK